MIKIKPPTFNGERKKDEDVDTWLFGMRKYFQLHKYSSHVEGRIFIYQLKGKAYMKDSIELKLGNMTIVEYERRFLELLKYVSFIKDETVKV
jgi:hypothetical protein